MSLPSIIEPGRGKKVSVCIIDDEPDILEIYAKRFEMEGYRVVRASDGAQGLEVIRKEQPDIILLDLQMPVMNGYAVLDALFDDESLRKIPVVLLTNLQSDEIFRRHERGSERLHILIKAMTTPKTAVDYVHGLLEDSGGSASDFRMGE